jgi:type IV fimbrial biogenesis protein FimT
MDARGLSIVELLIALAIVAMLTAAALPAMYRYAAAQDSTAAINQLTGAVQFSRSAAITSRRTVTLCPSANGVDCAKRDDWHLGAIAFTDQNQNGIADPEDVVMAAFPPLPSGSRAFWRSFRNKSYLSFTPSGLTSWQNGHFRFCPRDPDPRLIREIVVNPQGRVRRAPDKNHDGIVEDTSGRPVTCPE